MTEIRSVLARNASPLTLDGTRTYIIGSRQVVVIDPGPLLSDHVDAVAAEVGSGVAVSIISTHAHPDHDEAAHVLARRFGTLPLEVLDGDEIESDAGTVRTIATPGHTPDHYAFHLVAHAALFCGDLMMGGMDTTLVAAPEGDLHAYLASLSTVRALQCTAIYPAHGEPFTDPEAALTRYERHRMERVQQVTAALQNGPHGADALVDRIYGPGLDERLRAYARDAVLAYLQYLRAEGRARLSGGMWSLA